MLQVLDIRHSFHQHLVLKGVTFSVPEGSITGVIGPSGVGKSVLLKIIGGVLLPDHGEICLPGGAEHSDRGMASDEASLMFQEGALFDSLTVYDNVAFPLVRGRVPTMTIGREELEGVHEKVQGILDRVGLSKASGKFPAQLSGGMRRRVSLARALVSRPKILLLDDPTSGLDPVASGVIMELIRDLHGEYRPTTIMVSQDLRRLLPAVQHIVALFDGEVQFAGSLSELARAASEPVRHFVSCRYDLGYVQ